MDKLSADLLEMIFMNLESKEMVKSRRVEKRFLQTIDGSKRNWRSLVIPIKLEFWDPDILEMFDRNSESSIRQLSVKFVKIGNNDQLDFIETLKKSKKSLTSFSIQITRSYIMGLAGMALETFPYLVDLRTTNAFTSLRPMVSLVIKPVSHDGKGLRVFWYPGPDDFFGSMLWDSKNLTSLSIEEPMVSMNWRRLLVGSSKTLKHLRIFIYQRKGMNEAVDVEGIEFPRLQVLQFRMTYEGWNASIFPSWMLFPFSCKLLLERISLPRGLPSVSELWIGGEGWLDEMNWANKIGGNCPLLETLRFDSRREKFTANLLLNLLRKRQENVEAGLEVDGVKMIPLKRLVVHLTIINQKESVLSEVQELVEEIVDLESVPEKIELEV